MDGVGEREDKQGNAVKMAYTPHLDYLKTTGLYRTLKAHGTAVGLVSDQDMGNSEVGHNAMGAGRVFDQGAKLVDKAILSGSIFRDKCWQELVKYTTDQEGTLHLIGLLSDGNVHSHERHLFALMGNAKRDGVKRVRIHALLDGRDVPEKSAEIYAERLEANMALLRDANFDIKVASGGGRMVTTMDRYNADWQVVARGWEAHVHGRAEFYFESLGAAIQAFRKDKKLIDQYVPSFVIEDDKGPVGKIVDGDGVVFFNFRGDRAIEISRAFDEPDLDTFDRGPIPKVYFAGMMEYDGDLKIPKNYLVSPPMIDGTLGEYFAKLGVKQFACSETQKYGHVTYFWNGNRSGKFNDETEEYVEVPSDLVPFDQKPWMKAYEITEATIERLLKNSFDFGRINFANGDMVGHTGNLEASIIAMSTVDMMIGRLSDACERTDTILVVTADHGNCDEMFEGGKPDAAKTSHTLNPVPFIIYDPRGNSRYKLHQTEGTLAHIAATVIDLMGLPPKKEYLDSLVEIQ
jgi:2,3-bisphosphoglycerate-independent phosphoglycerate mutase